MDGWIGKILRVNLTEGTWKVEDLDIRLAKAFIGGRGLATKILFDEVAPNVDPLSPDNKLIFATGPSTGAGGLGGSRYMVVAKSPLTETVACSNSGGFFGPALKFAGYDLIIFEGKAKKPVYLSIVDDEIELRSARHLWGKTTHQTEDTIRADIGDSWKARETKIASIGPAGEKLVRLAAIINDKHRAAGRSGVGAVMGSKNLKAITVRGTGAVTIADSEGYQKALLTLIDADKKSPITRYDDPGSYAWQGTARGVTPFTKMGIFPVRNFSEGVLEGAEKINGVTLRDTILKRPISCFSCPIACGRWTELKADGLEGEGPEYETIGLFGGSCGINDLSAITKANYLCNELGMDTIEMGGAIACAMELFEKGYLPEKDIGFKLNFGDAKTMVKLVKQTGLRQGFGDVLAEGGYRVAEKYGHPELFMGVKKQSFAAYEPRGLKGRGLGYVTSNRGACHMKGIMHFVELSDPLSIEGKPAILKGLQDLMSIHDSAGHCFFNLRAIAAERLADVEHEIVESITGAGYTKESMLRAGERIWNLERLFNLGAGITKKDDTLPPRMLKEPMPNGPIKGQLHELDIMLPQYYKLRGWDENGVPTHEKIAELELEEEAKILNIKSTSRTTNKR